ncbi:MAG: zf-HC2 domain-containing protein [Blastocatellia bacterium]
MKCEDALLAVMAMLDGELTETSRKEATAHLAACESCQREAEQIRQLGALFGAQRRHEYTADLWPFIAARLPAPRPARWQPFVWAAGLLVPGKLLELLPERDASLWFKLLPVLIVLALFGWLKENPFRINTELTLEREEI